MSIIFGKNLANDAAGIKKRKLLADLKELEMKKQRLQQESNIEKNNLDAVISELRKTVQML